jgi:L-lactate dehydrogenase (cytochrome)
MNMRLIGARTIDELAPEMVDASGIHSHVGLTPQDNLYNSTCESRCFILRHFC